MVQLAKDFLALTLSEFISKVELAVIRRMPFPVQSAYIFELKQIVEFPKCLSSTYNDIFIKKTYQPLAPLPAHSVIVDLGTNLGVFTMYANGMVRYATIYCFEANPILFPYLKANLDRMPDCGNDIKAFNVAISDKAGILEFTIDHVNIASVASIAVLDTSQFPDAENYRPIKVSCNRLDSFVSSRIDYLKCDIEGSEYSIFEDSLLSPDRLGQAVIEFHDIYNRLNDFYRIIETAFRNQFVIHISGFGEAASHQQVDEALRFIRNSTVIIKLCSQPLLGSGRAA